MKTLKIFSLLLAVVLLTPISQVHALKMVPFPDNKTLQPMPTPDVRPNISGNVNFSADQIYKDNSDSTDAGMRNFEESPTLDNSETGTANPTETSSKKSSSRVLSIIFTILILLVLWFFVREKMKSSL